MHKDISNLFANSIVVLTLLQCLWIQDATAQHPPLPWQTLLIWEAMLTLPRYNNCFICLYQESPGLWATWNQVPYLCIQKPRKMCGTFFPVSGMSIDNSQFTWNASEGGWERKFIPLGSDYKELWQRRLQWAEQGLGISLFFLSPKLWNSRAGRKPKGHSPTEAAGLFFCLGGGRILGTFAKTPILWMEFSPIIFTSRTHAKSTEKKKFSCTCMEFCLLIILLTCYLSLEICGCVLM